jgi:hypothetical protein
MIGTWSAWSPPSGWQPKSLATRQIADAFATVIASRQARERVAALKREQESADATRRQEEEVLVKLLEIELRALRTAKDLALLERRAQAEGFQL